MVERADGIVHGVYVDWALRRRGRRATASLYCACAIALAMMHLLASRLRVRRALQVGGARSHRCSRSWRRGSSGRRAANGAPPRRRPATKSIAHLGRAARSTRRAIRTRGARVDKLAAHRPRPIRRARSAAWRELRSAILATRSFYTPHRALLDEANGRIADRSWPTPKSPRGTRARRRPPRAGTPRGWRRTTRRRVGWTLLALVGLAAWIGCALGFFWRGVDDDDRLRAARRVGVGRRRRRRAWRSSSSGWRAHDDHDAQEAVARRRRRSARCASPTCRATSTISRSRASTSCRRGRSLGDDHIILAMVDARRGAELYARGARAEASPGHVGTRARAAGQTSGARAIVAAAELVDTL